MEKLLLGQTCCGPTYRKSAREKLINSYFNHPDVYYGILTDDKEYFNGIERDNLIVNELKDFYPDFPHLERYEWFLESSDAEDYGKKFVELNYSFPYATMRFHLLQAQKFGISNVALVSTDSTMNIDHYSNIDHKKRNIIYGGARWMSDENDKRIRDVAKIIKDKYDIAINDRVLMFDEAVRYYSFENVDFMMKFFEMWNYVVTTLYLEDIMHYHRGSYVTHDEFLLGAIYNALGITGGDDYDRHLSLFLVQHNEKIERFWA